MSIFDDNGFCTDEKVKEFVTDLDIKLERLFVYLLKDQEMSMVENRAIGSYLSDIISQRMLNTIIRYRACERNDIPRDQNINWEDF